jgi:hypothetical protein
MTMLPATVRAELRAIDVEIAQLRERVPPSRAALARRHKKGVDYIAPAWYADFLKRWRRRRERQINELLARKKAVKRTFYEAGA